MLAQNATPQTAAALCVMQYSETTMDHDISEELRVHALKAGWVFVLINLSALLLYLFGATEFAFSMFFVQVVALTVWILPFFTYQYLVKRKTLKIAFLRAVTSYRRIFENVSW